jgi:hypothetical protein
MIRPALLCIALLPALALAVGAAEPQYYNEVYTFSNGGGHATGTGLATLDACIGQPVAGRTWKTQPPPPGPPDYVIAPDGWDMTSSESFFVPAFFPSAMYINLFRGYNLIALPQLPDKTYTAETLLQEINAKSEIANRVLQYTPSGYNVYTLGESDPFELRAGEGYYVRCTQDGRWEMKGYPFTRASTTIALGVGYNLVALNLNPSIPYTASSALADIPNANRMLQFDAASNGYNTYTTGDSGTGFTLSLGEGYFIRTSAPTSWVLTRD